MKNGVRRRCHFDGGGLGIRGVVLLAPSAYLASAANTTDPLPPYFQLDSEPPRTAVSMLLKPPGPDRQPTRSMCLHRQLLHRLQQYNVYGMITVAKYNMMNF